MGLLRKKKDAPDQTAADLGFGTLLGDEVSRFINRDGTFNVQKVGNNGYYAYEQLVEMSWSRFFLVVGVYFVGVNLLFAFGFGLIGLEHIAGMEAISFWPGLLEAFFFSVQTFTSVGYGVLHPSGPAANLLASLDALVGLMSFALATGLFFSRFARPVAKIAFSNIGLITPFRDGTSFQMRMVNKRSNQLINMEARMMLTWMERNPDGIRKRQFASLDLELNRISLFPMNWTLVHPIKKESPLFEKTAEDLRDMQVEVLVMVQGFDETYHQEIHARASYLANEIRWGVRFLPMFNTESGQATRVDLALLDATVPLEGQVVNGV
ncbi:MAG: transporter [Saprospiraceae bacterium]|nr:transporter [Saprospiraceae bacterium]